DDDDHRMGPAPLRSAGGWEIGLARQRGGGHVREERPPGDRDRERFVQRDPSEKPVRVFPFGLSRARLDQAVRATSVPVEVVADVREADAVITLRSYYRSKPPSLREAEERSIPIYVIKSNTAYQMEQALLQF